MELSRLGKGRAVAERMGATTNKARARLVQGGVLFEAMHCGKVLVVDDKVLIWCGGRRVVVHGGVGISRGTEGRRVQGGGSDVHGRRVRSG